MTVSPYPCYPRFDHPSTIEFQDSLLYSEQFAAGWDSGWTSHPGGVTNQLSVADGVGIITPQYGQGVQGPGGTGAVIRALPAGWSIITARISYIPGSAGSVSGYMALIIGSVSLNRQYAIGWGNSQLSYLRFSNLYYQSPVGARTNILKGNTWWVRFERTSKSNAGGQLVGYASPDGSLWQEIGRASPLAENTNGVPWSFQDNVGFSYNEPTVQGTPSDGLPIRSYAVHDFWIT